MALVAPVSRTTIFVRDMARAKAFYCDLLGLTAMLENVIPNPGASQILGQPCEGLHICILRAADTTIGNIGLAAVIGADPPLEERKIPDRVALGDACLVIRTDHLRELLPRLRAFRGVRILSEPTHLVLPIPDEVWEMFLRDPDRTMINLSYHGTYNK